MAFLAAIVLAQMAAACSSDHSRTEPRPSPTPPACPSSVSAGADHVALRLSSAVPRPVARAHRGTVITVTVSYRNETVQVPKVYGGRAILCLLDGSRKPHRQMQVRYVARQAGTVTISSGLAAAEGHVDSPALFGMVKVA